MTRCVLDKNDGIPGGRGGGVGLAGGVLKPREARGGAELIGGGGETEEDGAGLTAGAVALLGAGLFWAKRSGGRLSGAGGFKPVAAGRVSGAGSSGTGVGGVGQFAPAAVGAFRFVV